MFFDNEDKEVEEEVFTEEGEVDEEVGSTDKEVQDIFIELDSILFVVFFDNEEEEVEDIFTEVDNIDLEVINILFVFFQVSVW